MTKTIPEPLYEVLNHGNEETYLEYKGAVPWTDRVIMLGIVKTIFALSNERDGGIIIIGVNNDGELVGLSEEFFDTYDHDQVNQFLSDKCNQQIQCKVEKYKDIDIGEGQVKNFVFFQVGESKEYPVVYTGKQELANERREAFSDNIILRSGALYIRNATHIGNKEITTKDEWQEIIERTHKKYSKETIRRSSILIDNNENPHEGELSI